MVNKIFLIAIISAVLLLVETLAYILLRKLVKSEYFSRHHLDDAYITGIGIVILIAIMLWRYIE